MVCNSGKLCVSPSSRCRVMDRETAGEVMKLLKSLDPIFHEIGKKSRNIDDEDEQVDFRMRLGKVVGDIYTDLMLPIIKEYPELDPDR